MSDSHRIDAEPYYRPTSDEVEVFEAAWRLRLPVLLKGPTGCGKSRFVEHMAWRLGRPLVTVACNEDISASDLAGRFLLEGGGTRWQDGPLTRAARMGAICYLDEVVEARQDTLVLIHPLTDHRRMLPLDKTGEQVAAHPDFLLVVSYNPGYQSLMKDLKQSTRQRFAALEFDYPDRPVEADIVARESGLDLDRSLRLVDVAHGARALKGHGLDEGVSTRLVVYAARLVAEGIPPARACVAAMIQPMTDDPDVAATLVHAVEMAFG
ncbi:MAG: CbbQ/NirQ/NorQ/GpvN family protein [Magnetospirillum sp.]|nr:MAG: CbbQ/NirQ/NorQ/GpvN family protein [Magnetospirillum sp.]